MERLKTFLALLGIFFVPLFVFLLGVQVYKVGSNYFKTFPERTESYQRKYLNSISEDGIIKFENVSSDFITFNASDPSFSYFHLENCDFGEQYKVRYEEGKVEVLKDGYFVEIDHNYTDSTEFMNDIFSMEIYLSEYDLNINTSKYSSPRQYVSVTCELTGDSYLKMDFKYKNEVIVIDDVTIRYTIYFDEHGVDLLEEQYNPLRINIQFNYNDSEYRMYVSTRD